MSKISRDVQYTAQSGYDEAYEWRVERFSDDTFLVKTRDSPIDPWRPVTFEHSIGINDMRVLTELFRTAVFA